MVSLDDTRPNRPKGLKTPPQPPVYTPPSYYAEPDSGPGCLVWGMMGLFSLGLAGVVVILAALAGWTDGLRVAGVTATARSSHEIASQCHSMAEDVLNNRPGLLEQRLNYLMTLTPAPDCVAFYIPTATALFIQNQPTATPTSTATSTAAPTPELTLTSAPPEMTAVSTAPGGFDPAPLLADAQTQITAGDYKAAIASLEAIVAIDPNYEKATVDRLLYQALTAEATRLYRTGGNLAEAILLTNRAEEYGDVGELNFERQVAMLYLDAQAAKNINFSLAIQLLSRVVSLAPNYRDAAGQLFDQYVKYGDALALSGDNCKAQRQYDAALTLQQPDALRLKRDAAAQACQFGVTPTIDPALITPGAMVTADPNLQQPPTPAGSQVAPIGQPGG